ncbi:MAG: hypothetical protein AAFW97_00235 [Pseudomonadota bacterium]
MDMPLIYALAGLVCVAGFLGLFLYLGHRSSRDDLVAPPEFGQRDTGKRDFGEREHGRRPPRSAPRDMPPPSAPALPASEQTAAQLVSANAEPQPMTAPDDFPDADPAAVWRREGPAGRELLSEACYTADQYAEREVKALLLQNRTDRAIRHVRGALKLPAAEAEAYVARLAHQLGL